MARSEAAVKWGDGEGGGLKFESRPFLVWVEVGRFGMSEEGGSGAMSWESSGGSAWRPRRREAD